MLNGNKDEFNKLYNSFYLDKKGFKAPKWWFDRVEKNHEEIREELGSPYLVQEIELESHQGDAHFSEIDKITERLLCTIPGYFHEYQEKRKNFVKSIVDKGEFKGMQRTTHINHWLKKNKIAKPIKDQVNIDLSKLGLIWVRAKTTKRKLYVTLTTHALFFATLGCYGVDNKSCFRQGRQHEIHKYLLGQHPRTYVVLVTSKHWSDNSENHILARYWGFASTNFRLWSLCNGYMSEEDKGDIYYAVDKFFSKILDVENAKRDTASVVVDGVYLNKGHIVYSRPDYEYDSLVGKFGCKDITETNIKQCYKCQGTFILEELSSISDKCFCYNCLEKLLKCEFSGMLSFDPLIKAYTKDGKEINICLEIIQNDIFILCPITQKYWHSDCFVPTKLYGSVSEEGIKRINYEECSECHNYLHWKYIKQTNDKSMCYICAAKYNGLNKHERYSNIGILQEF